MRDKINQKRDGKKRSAIMRSTDAFVETMKHCPVNMSLFRWYF